MEKRQGVHQWTGGGGNYDQRTLVQKGLNRLKITLCFYRGKKRSPIKYLSGGKQKKN